ncbi:MAG TPA: mannose-6-phosphate isomerase [Paludibacteraceae bacterium]|nr:mannose-6-phosphate isomerase [Paludibacteraceae bacterium]HQB69524.1 mannose-6-phosphate isomerase [Paludibacteraceae bacterium]HRS68193.1 mannose-6-phosphate isomerase [Paludibacteraceae bacterium]
MLYPLKFKPIHKTTLWGGSKLSRYHRHDAGKLKQVGETWDVSGVEGSESEVENGFLAGNTLNELVEVYMGDLVGDAVYGRFGNQFPLLVKLIDSAQQLSIQVHPNNEIAAERHNMSGKSEMWYVLDAEPNAFLIAGFCCPVDKTTYLKLVAENRLEDVLQKHPVSKGDLFYIPAGCVHSIGAGCVLLEVQQTSDLTYRIYDYNRVDAEGNLRELHTDLAVDAIDFENWRNSKIVPAALHNEVVKVVDSEHFISNIITLDKPQEYDLSTIDSFVLLTVLEGHLRCKYDDDYITLVDGETVLIPASMNSLVLIPTGKVKLLEVYIQS